MEDIIILDYIVTFAPVVRVINSVYIVNIYSKRIHIHARVNTHTHTHIRLFPRNVEFSNDATIHFTALLLSIN